MNIRSQARAFVVVLSLAVFLPSPSPGSAQEPPPAPTSDDRTLLVQMAGTWDVRQRMWTGPGTEPVPLPAATAHRRLVHSAYLEEDLTLAHNADGEPFTRHAVLSRNEVKQTFEYFSIDSRLPQMMMYPADVERHGDLSFALPEPFVAPSWGDATDVPFAARLQVQPGENRQIVRLYLRRLSAQPTEEFLAFEYIYTRAGG